MSIIQLQRQWHLGSEFSAGGFGHIYKGKSDDGEDIVIKLIPKYPGADRELLFVDLTGESNVMPIYDSGEWNENWVLVMPQAEKSLRDHIEIYGVLSIDDSLVILTDIFTALAAIKDRVVHRDLKPENVLLYDGQWCLSDFGISRYAEATTATETWKYAKTMPYAAPEQWQGIHATHTTDVYAAGIIAYEMIAGKPPFNGPSEEDYRRQHLGSQPEPISDCSPALAAIIMECLFKSQEARPSASNILQRLQAQKRPVSDAELRLQQSNEAIAEEQARVQAEALKAQSEADRRQLIAMGAKQSFISIITRLKDKLLTAASQAQIRSQGESFWTVKLGNAEFGIRELHFVSDEVLKNHHYPFTFEVVTYSEIYIAIPQDEYGYEGRSHSLWFCDATNKNQFRWYETAFMINPLMPKRGRKDPFAMQPGENTGGALSPTMTEYQVAWPFTAIDQGEEDEFIERWIGWFADAVQGRLRHPSHMPERDPKGSWRIKG